MRQKPPPPPGTLNADLKKAMLLLPQVADLQMDYRPWRKVLPIARQRHLDPETAWLALKLLRAGRIPLPLLQSDGKPFVWCPGNHLLEPLHRIDRAVGGGGPASLARKVGPLADEAHRTRLRIRTLMDEAAESSMIEGAATTRKVAVEMLRTGRTPRDKSERMVLNNYVAMQWMKQRVSRPLSTEMLAELQAMLTDGTNPDDERGRLRRPDEDVRVWDERANESIFVPPPAEALPARLEKLCEFANQTHAGTSFLHPILKACILHFMIGYEHPFVDGNGRTARAIVYWFALRNGYDIFEFIPISELIRAGYAAYPQAYLDSEQDEGDLTYFIVYHLDIIERSIDVFMDRLAHEEQRIERAQHLITLSKGLNPRQRILLDHALRHPLQQYTAKSHSTSNGITNNTARSDLEGLVKKRFLATTRTGREVVYHPAPGLAARLAKKRLAVTVTG